MLPTAKVTAALETALPYASSTATTMVSTHAPASWNWNSVCVLSVRRRVAAGPG